MVEARNAFKIVIPKSQVTRPIGRTDLKWEGTVKIDVKVVMREDSTGSEELQVGVYFVDGNYTSDSTKNAEFLEQLFTIKNIVDVDEDDYDDGDGNTNTNYNT
jgi:hypothetical protein